MIADTSRLRAMLDWNRNNDLETIAAHALAWEENCSASATANCRRRIGLNCHPRQFLRAQGLILAEKNPT